MDHGSRVDAAEKPETRGEGETPAKEVLSRRVWPGSVPRERCGWTLITYLLRYAEPLNNVISGLH